ncbi:DNA-binding MarR family transcriptional regulator [Natranaerovirga pectinivora]|uniref:DNA-binding MarR family transcriptional regulator n=1 Tax=Natranaerovirga pectinivora TaxID=682400 RepID=A0A4V2V0G9_9FIRM|nr:MarR family transcriptional regulator [Natranaerovirga pectinivora]TCT16077.1 DNA-binding MarR family transcriptional regulator [Natranaerovirga pectinivora]
MEDKRTIGFELRTLTNLIRRRMESRSHLNSITPMHSWAITFLYENRNKDIFQKDFEDEFSIRRSTSTKILQLMEKNGLITRHSVEYDGRLKKIVLTQKAIEYYFIIAEEINLLEELFIKGISQEELDAFFATMDKIKKNLE